MQKIYKLFIYIFCISSVVGVKAQMDQDYFDKLQTERIESSDVIEWTQFGPGMSGYCEEFWCHPTDENVMFQSPDMYNSYGTWDNGVSWQTIKDEDGNGKDMRRIQAITFSHQDANFGLAIDVRGHLYKSTDQGRNWNLVSDNFGGKHSELAVDPSNDNIWYMGAGNFWNVKSNHRSQESFDDPTTGYFYDYAEYGHIYKSTNKGQDWIKVTSVFPAKTEFGKIIVDPRNSDVVIAVTNYGIYRSSNQGIDWALSIEGLPHHLARDMDYYYNASDDEFILYCILQTKYEADGSSVKSSGGVYKSTDGGVNWISATGNLNHDLISITDWSSRDKYYNTITYWFGITEDEALAAYPDYPSEILPVFNRIVVNPIDKNEVYLGKNVKHDKSFGASDVWKTSDGGSTWKPSARTGTYWDSDKDETYWSDRNVGKTTNTKFAHLQRVVDHETETYGNRFLTINSVGDVFICLDQQVLRTNNNGESWEQVDDFETYDGSTAWVGRGASNLPGRFMLLQTGIDGRYFFCSGEHGLWQSAPLEGYPDKRAIPVTQIEGQNVDGGATSIAAVAVNPKNSDEVSILMFRQDHSGYYRKSTDGGKTWANISKPIDWVGNVSGDMMFQNSLMIDYNDPDNIYFTQPENAITDVSKDNVPDDYENFGVYRSTDSGATWTRPNTGFPSNCSVHRLIMHPENPEILYAALNESKTGVAGGLYKSTNKGDNWAKLSIPSQIVAVNNVFMDGKSKDLFISCGREEGSISEGGVWKSTDDGSTWTKIFEMPWVWQAEVSPVNSDIITVCVALPHENKGASNFNPGLYVSFDGGDTWEKVNQNIGQPDTVVDFKPDPKDENIFWCALKGSGWAVGYHKDYTGSGWAPEEEEISNSVSESSFEKSIVIFPNPVNDICNLSFGISKSSNVSISVYDVMGSKTLSFEYRNVINANELAFSTKDLATGFYFISIVIDDTMYTKQFLKQ
ncbi:VPS10 domain-containing protein [Saccharicrinis aurantiacus]|uniref:VPS10 domain-containing protein n=1 Tax=Saccharicrinis aurantiacus TaxID=1849719 RepID=UPI0015C5821C|nr:T9SS type A sorting domain-containing protein [Saccharicrinis aurantiacus]